MPREFIIQDPAAQTSLAEAVVADSVNIVYEDEGARLEFRVGSGIVQKFWLPCDLCWKLVARDGEPL